MQALAALLFLSMPVSGQDTLALWPKGAPGALGSAAHDSPSLICYPAHPKNGSGTAVVICPGGGYRALAMNHEGQQVAAWLNSLGISAYIVTYRLSTHGYRHPAPLLDGQRAIRTVRANAGKWSLDPDKIGVLGFSAGGHLAATLGTQPAPQTENSPDKIEQVRGNPDFMLLLYPVIAFDEAHTHRGSQEALLGPDAGQTLLDSLSAEKSVGPHTPPTFLVHTSEDNAVPPENSIAFYLALRKAKVPAELHVFEHGKHGLGLGPDSLPFSAWPGLCSVWLKKKGYID